MLVHGNLPNAIDLMSQDRETLTEDMRSVSGRMHSARDSDVAACVTGRPLQTEPGQLTARKKI
jgi:hypothetical protein